MALRAWLYQITLNVARNRFRGKKLKVVSLDHPLPRRRRRAVRGRRRRGPAAGRALRAVAQAGRHRDARRRAARAVPRAADPALRRGPAPRRGRPRAQAAAWEPRSRTCIGESLPCAKPLVGVAPGGGEKVKTMKDALTVARALRGVPLEKAPATLLPAVLRRVGLADAYWRLESPVGPVYIAHSKAGISMVRRAKSAAEFERGVPAALRARDPSREGGAAGGRAGARPESQGQGQGPARAAVRPAGPLRVRAGRPAEGARDPARRGAAVQLDRQGDRPPGRGARRGVGAGEEPGAAPDPVPPGRAQRRAHRQLLARRAAQQADAARGRGRAAASCSSGWRPRASATSATRRRSTSATRPAAGSTRWWRRTRCGSTPSARRSRRGYHPCEDCRPPVALAS